MIIIGIISGGSDANLDRGSESPLDREGLAGSYSGHHDHEGGDDDVS